MTQISNETSEYNLVQNFLIQYSIKLNYILNQIILFTDESNNYLISSLAFTITNVMNQRLPLIEQPEHKFVQEDVERILKYDKNIIINSINMIKEKLYN